MNTVGEVFVVTASGSGHLFPCIELCKHLSSLNYTSTLVLPSTTSSSHLHPIASVIQITAPTRGKPHQIPQSAQMGSELEAHLSARPNGLESPQLVCAIVDFQMGWTKNIFWKFKIPVISFFTFGACAAAMEWGAWKSRATGVIPGLPDGMRITRQDMDNNLSSRATGDGGPPRPGDRPPWVPLVEGSIALMFNTCDDLERPFMKYLANQMGLPIWGVGPLFPNQFWSLSNAIIHDVQIRQPKHQSDNSEEKVLNWLDSKPQNSVLYVSFGSEVSPTNEELIMLASVLEEMAYSFIWVLQNELIFDRDSKKSEGFINLDELDEKVRCRGLIIRGWAPQLLILSHPSTHGFLSHCGWNSTLEAIGLGVPILAWPIRGDQVYNAKLVVQYLKIGYLALPSGSVEMVKNDLKNGIEKLMMDEVVHKQVETICAKFSCGFPNSSRVALNAFQDFVRQNQIC